MQIVIVRERRPDAGLAGDVRQLVKWCSAAKDSTCLHAPFACRYDTLTVMHMVQEIGSADEQTAPNG